MYKSSAQEHYLEWYINPSSDYEGFSIDCGYDCTKHRNTIFTHSKGIHYQVMHVTNGNPVLEVYNGCGIGRKPGSERINIASGGGYTIPKIMAFSLFRNNKGLYGIQDENCQALIEPVFEDITNFSITSDLFFVKYQNKWGAIKNPFKQFKQSNPIKSLKQNNMYADLPITVDYMPDEKNILVSNRNYFEVFNIQTGESKYTIPGASHRFIFHYSNNKKYLAFREVTYKRNDKITIVNLNNFNLEKTLTLKKDFNQISISDDGKYVFSVSNVGIYVTDVETEKSKLIDFNKKYDYAPTITLQSYVIDGQNYISSLQNDVWMLWDAKTQKLIIEKKLNHGYIKNSQKALLKHKPVLVVYHYKTGEYTLLDLISDTKISLNTDGDKYDDSKNWDYNSNNRWSHFSNENYIVCGNIRPYKSILRIWNIKTGALIKNVAINSYGGVPGISLASNNQSLLITSGVSIWSLNPEQKPLWKVNPNINPVPQALANIIFTSPALDYTTISTNSIEVRVCVRSQTPITKTILYIDGLPYKNRDWDIVPSNDCQVVINQSISLQGGTHQLKITATNEAGTATSEEKTIEVQGNLPDPITISKNYALLIAVQDYTDPNINSLNKPIADAEALKSVLTSKYGFPTNQVTLLRNPTKSEIENALIHLRNLSSQDNLLLYYGGHGTMDGNLGFWLPSNATKRNRDNWLSNSDVIGYIGRIPSKHTLALVDACFGGSLIMRDLGEEHACEIQGSLTSRQAMTSGTKTVVPDESVFMRYLIKKLNENTESCLAADKLFNLLKTPVINNSPIKQVPLMSPIPSTGDEGGSFIFRLRY